MRALSVPAASRAVSRSWYGAGIVGVRGGSKNGGAAAGAGESASAAEMLDFGGGGEEAGEFGAANRRPRSPNAHRGALRFSFTAATVGKIARTRRLTLPAWEGGAPPMQCATRKAPA